MMMMILFLRVSGTVEDLPVLTGALSRVAVNESIKKEIEANQQQLMRVGVEEGSTLFMVNMLMLEAQRLVGSRASGMHEEKLQRSE